MDAPSFPPGYVEASIGGTTLAVAIAFIVLEITIVALRFIVRYLSKVRTGLDDALIIPALVFCVGVCVLAIVEVKVAGVGQHEDALLAYNPRAVENWAKCGYAIEQLYCIAVVLPKLSILGFYIRIFTLKPYRITVYILVGVLIANCIAGLIVSFSSCQPFAARWRPSIPGAHCIDTTAYWRWISFANILTDVVMLGLPLPVIWHLQISKSQKYGLTVVFCAGSIGLVASIIRFNMFNLHTLSDGTWASAKLAIWSLVEPGVYLIAACLPSFRPVISSLSKYISSNISFKDKKSRGSDETGPFRNDISLGETTPNGPRITIGRAKSAGFTRLDGDKKSSTNIFSNSVGGAPVHDEPQHPDGKASKNAIMIQQDYEVRHSV